MPVVSLSPPKLVRATSANGLFARLREQWAETARKYGDEEFSPAQLAHAEKIVSEQPPDPRYGIYVLTDEAESVCHGLAHFNRARLPGSNGWTLRVVWALLAPQYDYEDISDELAAWLIGGLVYAALDLCANGDMKANHLKIHLQNRSDRRLAAGLVQRLHAPPAPTTVDVRGNWLHIDNVSA